MTIKTVVAVSYGDSGFGQPISCEVFTRDRQSLAPGELSQMVAAHSPQPGDLDDPTVVRRRYSRLREMGGRVEAVPSHAIEMAERVTGDSGREVLDADYREPIGQVLAFDAEVDDDTGEVDWYTAMPHPETNPYSLVVPGAENKIYRRADGALLSTARLASGEHRVRVDQQGHNIPVNEFGQVVEDLTDADWELYNSTDLSGLSRETMVVCARKDPDGHVKVTCEPFLAAANRGALLDPREHGFYARALDHESVREHAGGNQAMTTDLRGEPIWVGVVEAGRGKSLPSHRGNTIMDGLGSSSSRIDVPDVSIHMSRSGSILVDFGDAHMANRVTSRQADPAAGALLGGYAPEPAASGPGPLHMGIGPRPEPATEPLRPMPGRIPPGPLNMGQREQSFGAAARSAGSTSTEQSPPPRSEYPARPQSFGVAARSAGFGSTQQPTSAHDLLSGAASAGQSSRPRPLAGMNATVRTAAARYGPQLVESAKSTLNDPQVRSDLKKVARVGVEAAIMAKGGGKLRAGAAVHAVGQLKDLPTVDRVRHAAAQHGLSGLRAPGTGGQSDRRSSEPEL